MNDWMKNKEWMTAADAVDDDVDDDDNDDDDDNHSCSARSLRK